VEIVPSTGIAAVLVAVMVAMGPYRGLLVFFALMPMGAMAAFNLPAAGGASITASDLAIIVLFLAVAFRSGAVGDMIGTMRPGQPGFLLLLFLGYATLATLFFPRVFEGQTDVFGIGRISNAVGIVIRPLRPDGGNLSQLFRMFSSILAFITLAALFRRKPDLSAIRAGVIAATLVHVVLGVLDVVSYAAGALWLMEPFRTANYTLAINHEMAGIKRMIGGFPEASAFGYFTLGLFGFWLRSWLADPKDRWSVLYLGLSFAVLLRSTSTSAYVASVFLVLLVVLTGVLGNRTGAVARRAGWVVGLSMAMIPVAVFAAVGAYELVPEIKAFMHRVLLDKMSSDSGVERMSWNLQAFRNFLDTWMLGAGLGSVRASNWVVACLATSGLVGAGLMFAWVWSVLTLRCPGATTEQRIMIVALQTGCLGLLVRALVVKASPNLDVLFFAMAGAAVGLTRAAAVSRRRGVLQSSDNPPNQSQFAA
jgi:hypothetical protein